MNKATVPTPAGFTEGRNRYPQQANADSLVLSGYKPSPRAASEVTVSPIQQGQVEKHYDTESSARPSIPESSSKANPCPYPTGSC